jgi:RNA polymerase-binding transcription factor DksA
MPRATPRSARATAKKAASAKKTAKKAVKKRAPVKKAAAKKPAVRTPERRGAGRRATPARKVAPKKAPAKKIAKKAPAKVAKKAAPTKKATPAKKAAPVERRSPAPALSPVPVKKAARKPIKSPFDAKFLDAQRELLLEERATYTRQAATLQAEADALVADFEPGDVQFDEESGEGDTLAVERERDLALSAQARAAVSEIDHALEKIKAGTYGVCEVSGLAIPKERLKAIPWARERVEYKAAGIGRL